MIFERSQSRVLMQAEFGKKLVKISGYNLGLIQINDRLFSFQ